MLKKKRDKRTEESMPGTCNCMPDLQLSRFKDTPTIRCFSPTRRKPINDDGDVADLVIPPVKIAFLQG